MKVLKMFRESFVIARRQREFRRALSHVMYLKPDDPQAINMSFRGLSKVFARWGDPARWEGHAWHEGAGREAIGAAAREATIIAYDEWTRGLWSNVGGVVEPPKQEQPAFLLPMSPMVQ